MWIPAGIIPRLFVGRRGGDEPHQHVCTRWGHTFVWTPQHQTANQLRSRRERYDSLADAALVRLNALRGKRDLYTTLQQEQHTEREPLLAELWRQAQSVPEWVDWDQIARAQEIFYRYGPGMLNGLAYHSLLGGMGANRIVEVLGRTGGFSPNKARRRMFETTQFILQCTMSLDSIQPGGAGHVASIKVRLLHAGVRQRILRLRDENPDYYDLEAFGIPINDLDSIVTILSFSASLVWISLPRQGLFLRKQEVVDYIALWRLIAHYVGCPTDVFETPELCRAYMESFLLTEVNPGSLSQVLSQNIIFSLAGQPPSYPSADFLVATARWLCGDELGDRLGLPTPTLKARALVLAQCLFLGGWCYFYRSMPAAWDRAHVQRLRRIFYSVIVEGKIGLGGESGFEFKYVPQMDTRTEAGKVDMTARWSQGVERRNMKVLVGVVGVVTVGFAGTCWMLSRALGVLSAVF